MVTHSFQVNVSSGFSNPDVERLSETEKSMSSWFGGEEGFRRAKSDFLHGEERLRVRGRKLGEIVAGFLEEAGLDYRLTAVNWNNTGSWTLEIETPSGAQNIVLSWFLVDDVMNAMTRTELQRVRNLVLFGLGRRDLIFRKPA